MTEPVTGAHIAAVMVPPAVAVPMLQLFGYNLGLSADVLLAGFSGAVAAMALLNSVPATGDTWRELLNTSARRMMVAVGSAMTAGYTAPLVSLINGVPPALILSVSFIVGAGAQQMLPWLIERFGKGKAQS